MKGKKRANDEQCSNAQERDGQETERRERERNGKKN